ncbi:hypothetical protein KBX50_05195 [Micromonospora sp. C51]|uniref:hypothetical protein n=1 Tax=Micromonospora sp. C51 TaxID=2824879 RepID=UPI001B389AE0|nr:hypothetical protein [Micromonospora sp. C51]MBQ1047854.1 hypothetical protein [Micromonospora sp. C51]
MTAPWSRFPDVQRALATLLEPLAGGAGHTGAQTPDDLQQVLPFIRITRRGGGSDRLNDYASVEVDVFADQYGGDDGAEALAERVRQFLTGAPRAVPPVVFDRITCVSGPTERPWAPEVRRFGAAYLVVSRRYVAS